MSSRRAGLLLACGLISGCVQLPDVPIEVMWGNAMDRMGLSPIYPLAEDVMVGDVYLDLRNVPETPDPNRPNYRRHNLLRIERAPRAELLDVLRGQMADRIFVRRVPSGSSSSGEPSPTVTTTTNVVHGATTTTQSTTSVRPTPRPRAAAQRPGPAPPPPDDVADGRGADIALRMNLVAMPALTVARVSNFQLGGGAAIQGVAANLGLGSSGSTALTINLRELQVLALEPRNATALLISILGRNANEILPPVSFLQTLAHYWRDGVLAICRDDQAQTSQAQIVIMTSVLFAGGIQYQFGRSSEFASRAAVDATASLTGARATALPALPGAAGSNAPATSVADLAARVDALAAAIPGAPDGSLLGAQTRLTVGSFGGLTLEQTFPRLMAVGANTSMRFRVQDAFRVGTPQDVQQVVEECSRLLGVPPPSPQGDTPGRVLSDDEKGLGRFRDTLNDRLQRTLLAQQAVARTAAARTSEAGASRRRGQTSRLARTHSESPVALPVIIPPPIIQFPASQTRVPTRIGVM